LLCPLQFAELWFEKAAETAPFHPDVPGNLGLVRSMQHRIDECYEKLIQATSLGYKSALAHFILGIISLEKGKVKVKEAILNLQKISAEQFPCRDRYRNEIPTRSTT
jgi:hypothetical protein